MIWQVPSIIIEAVRKGQPVIVYSTEENVYMVGGILSEEVQKYL